jgi:hypothetical protein
MGTIGMATAQGNAERILYPDRARGVPTALPWPLPPRTACAIGFAARGIDPALRGAARWRTLAEAALAEAGARPDLPIVVGSCNGGADGHDAESWTRAFTGLGVPGPIASAACASGLHAMWLATTRLAAGEPEVIVLAADALSPASHAHLEALRVLVPDPQPWQPTATGFIPGEAAVAIRLRRNDLYLAEIPRFVGPVLAHDRDDHDALPALARAVAPALTATVFGQGTGPAFVDDRELAAIRGAVPGDAPLSTALVHFGHTLGASGLLSVALAAINAFVRGRADLDEVFPMPAPAASDGRPLGTAGGDALVVCRALGGACVAVGVGAVSSPTRRDPTPAWGTPAPPPALRLPILRRIAADALARRPPDPPGALLVRLDAPLVPPDDAVIGGRLLPSVVLEITPGFIAQLVARAWGYGGPALCLVGGTDAEWVPVLADCRAVHGSVAVLHVHARDFEWG